MNRRSFLKKACVGAAIAAAAGTVGLSGVIVTKAPAPVVVDAIIGSYENYCSFSALAIAAAIDKSVADAATELSYQAGQSIKFIYNS